MDVLKVMAIIYFSLDNCNLSAAGWHHIIKSTPRLRDHKLFHLFLVASNNAHIAYAHSSNGKAVSIRQLLQKEKS